jgi:hypothetical protein
MLYFVTGKDSSRLLDLDLYQPTGGAVLTAETSFAWKGGPEGTVYVVTIRRSFDGHEVLKALTRNNHYRIPGGLFKQRLVPHTSYLWSVEAFDDDGSGLGESLMWEIRIP